MPKIKFLDNDETNNIYELKGKKLFSLFTGKDIKYTLKTDGLIEESEIWVDKWPYYRDSDLDGFGTLKRHEFIIDKPSFVLVEKTISGRIIKDLYINDLYIEALAKSKCLSFTQIEFNEKEKKMIKSLSENIWVLRK